MKFLLCPALLFFVVSYSQTKIDSLTTVLEQPALAPTTKIKTLNAIGFEYWTVDPNQSIHYGQKALDLARETNNDQGIAKAHRVLGVAHWTQGNLLAALEDLYESNTVYQQIDDNTGVANTLLNTGMVYADIGDYDKALSLYEEAITKFTALNLDNRIATTYTKMASLYMDRGDVLDSKTFLDNALSIHTKNQFTYGMAEVHNRLGIYFIRNNNPEQAYYHIQKSIALGSNINDNDGMVSNLIQYGKLLRMQGNLKEAEKHLHLSIQKAKENSLKKYELEAYNELKEVKEKSGVLDSALYFFEKYTTLKDSIFTSKKATQIAALSFRNQIEAKDKEVVLLQQQEKADRTIKWALLLGIIGSTVMGLVIISSLRQKNKKAKELAIKQEELLQSKKDLTVTALENAQLKQQELEQKLAYKNKELTSYALNFVQKNELFEQLQQKIKVALSDSGLQKEKVLKELSKEIKHRNTIDRDWEDFRRSFEEVHTNFYSKLKEKHPDLSNNDLKISALIRLNLNIKETASILGISPESAKTARYRLRKKLELSPAQDLLDYFLSLE